MNHRLRTLALLLSTLCAMSGCRSGKVIREDFTDLQRIEVPEAGISFLFPSDRAQLNLKSSHTISAYLNPVDEYPELGQDARFMMKVYFQKDNAPPFEPNELGKIRGGYGKGAPWAVFKKVIQCRASEYWHLEIDVGRYSIDGHEYFEEDIEIAKRILESVECLPPPENKPYLSDG